MGSGNLYMKKLCPDCEVRFDVNLSEFDEGDAVTCPDCNLEFTVVSDSAGKMKLRKSKELEMEDLDEAELDEDEDYDYD